VAAVTSVARFEISMFENPNDQWLAAVGLQENQQLVKLHLLAENRVQIGQLDSHNSLTAVACHVLLCAARLVLSVGLKKVMSLCSTGSSSVQSDSLLR